MQKHKVLYTWEINNNILKFPLISNRYKTWTSSRFLWILNSKNSELSNFLPKNEQLDQCCQQLVAMLCCTLSTTVVNNHCSQLFTFNNHCSIIVDNDQQACFIQQHCNNYCYLSTFEQLLIEQYSSTLSIQQVLLNLDYNIV